MMDILDQYRKLRLDRRIPAIPRTVVVLGIAGVVFSVIWAVVPAGALYWLLLPIVLVLVWLASFGWREGVSALIATLRRLENM
jgi:hypothetical protein